MSFKMVPIKNEGTIQSAISAAILVYPRIFLFSWTVLNFCSKIASGAGKAGFIYTIREMVSHIEEHRKLWKVLIFKILHDSIPPDESHVKLFDWKNMSLQTEV